MGEVVELDIVTSLDVPAERVLRKATEAELRAVVVVGVDKDGELYFASSLADSARIIWHLERAKYELFKVKDQIALDGDPRGRA